MLGQALMKEFAAANHEMIGYDREEIDIVDAAAVARALDELAPALVINAVALNAVDKIEESAELYAAAEEVNGRAPGRIAALCRDRGIMFVHYSSDYVFAGDRPAGYDEDAALAPVNAYGRTKALGEETVRAAGGHYYIIRLSKLFGTAAASEGAKKSFVDTMLHLVTIGGKASLDVVDEELSSPTYAPDLAAFTRALVEGAHSVGIYHGANRGSCTWYGWAKKIFALRGLSVQLNPVTGAAFPRLAARPNFSVLKNSKLPFQRSWEEALVEYLEST